MKSVLDNFDGIELWHINLDGIYVFLSDIFALQDKIEELRYIISLFLLGKLRAYISRVTESLLGLFWFWF